MCEPATIATVAAITSATATVAQGVGQLQQGQYEYGVAKYNARQLENEATRTRNVGVEEEMRKRQEIAQQVSRQRTQLAAQGVDIGKGTAALIQENTIDIGEVDALRIRRNFEDQAEAMEDQSALTLSQGKAAKRAGKIAFGTSLLSAAGSFLGTDAGSKFAAKWF